MISRAAVLAPARPATSPLLISLTVMLGMIMAIVDGTIVNVGLNTIVVGRLMPIVDARILTALSLLLSAWSCWWFVDLNGSAGLADVFWPRLIQGLGRA